VVADILEVEDCNFDRNGNQNQLDGLAVSAKRYVVDYSLLLPRDDEFREETFLPNTVRQSKR
jgi:hypothetical protein